MRTPLASLAQTIVDFVAPFTAYSTRETLRLEALQLPPGLNLTVTGPEGTPLPDVANASTAAALAKQLQLQAAVLVTALVRHDSGSYASSHAFQFLVGAGVIVWVYSMALLGPGASKRMLPNRVHCSLAAACRGVRLRGSQPRSRRVAAQPRSALLRRAHTAASCSGRVRRCAACHHQLRRRKCGCRRGVAAARLRPTTSLLRTDSRRHGDGVLRHRMSGAYTARRSAHAASPAGRG